MKRKEPTKTFMMIQIEKNIKMINEVKIFQHANSMHASYTPAASKQDLRYEVE